MKPYDFDYKRGLFVEVEGDEIELNGAVWWTEDSEGNVDGKGVDIEVPYSYEITSIDGASFTLYRKPGVTNKQIEIAKRMIRNNHDVVSLRVKPITGIIDRIEA